MLYLIGLGFEEKDLSLKAIDTIKKSDEVFSEFYTNTQFSISYIEKLTGKKIKILEREDVENKDIIVKKAKEKDISFLVSGDPLAGTTHFEIIHRLRTLKVKTQIIHNLSIFSVISETGLSIYKFGRKTTIPRKTEKYFPTSPYEIIDSNFKNNLHSLILLDIDLSAQEALNILLEIDYREKKKLFTKDTWILGCSKLGTSNSKILYFQIKDKDDVPLKEKPQCLILPSNLDHMEKEFLEEFKWK